jgi:hypothetical protein
MGQNILTPHQDLFRTSYKYNHISNKSKASGSNLSKEHDKIYKYLNPLILKYQDRGKSKHNPKRLIMKL